MNAGVQRRFMSAEPVKKTSSFSYIENPITGSIVLCGLTAAVGVFMLYFDEPTPATPEQANWHPNKRTYTKEISRA